MYLYDEQIELSTEEVRNIILHNEVIDLGWKDGWFTLSIRSEGLHDIRGLGMASDGSWILNRWFIEPSDSMNQGRALQTEDALNALDRAISFMRWSLAEERYRVNISYGDRTVITKGFMHRENADKFAADFQGAEVTITHRGLSLLDDSNIKKMEAAS